MKTAVKIFYWIAQSIFQICYFLPVIPIILLLSYGLGFGYLQSLHGNDSFFHVTNVFWFDRFFPYIPYWYPLQNAGVVPIWGYPVLAYFILIIIHKISLFNLVALFQIFGFLSVPLTALGLYLFIWTRLKNQTMALIAAVFYVVMPITWVWLFDWGFYTETTSYIFIFPTLIFYDIFLGGYLAKRVNVWRRLSLVGSILFASLLFLAHPSSFFATLFMAASLTLFQVIDRRPKILEGIKRFIIPLVVFTFASLMLLSFILFDFYAYSKTSAPAGNPENAKQEFLQGYTTPVNSLLGLAQIPQTDFKYGHRDIVVPPAIWIAAVAGLLLSLIYSRKAFALALFAWIPVGFFSWPIIVWYLDKIPFLSYVTPHRTVIIFIRSLMPLAAAFGIYTIFRFIWDIPTFWIKKGNAVIVKKTLTGIIATVGSLTLAAFLLLYFANKPTWLWTPTQIRYGPQVFDIRDPFGKKQLTLDSCQKPATDPNRPAACDVSFIRFNIDVDQFINACGSITSDQRPAICNPVIDGTVTRDQYDAFVQSCSQTNAGLCQYIKRINPQQIISYLSNMHNWPAPNLTGAFPQPLTRFSPFIAQHKNDPMLRIDVSPFLGGVVQTLNLESDISQINLYAVQLSKLGPYWGYEQQVFFSKNTGDTINVNNLAKWFGIKYLFLDNQLDPIAKYAQDTQNWTKVDPVGVWQFTNPTQMYSWTLQKPTVLVIGSQDRRAFEPLFRVSVNGGYPYDNGWLVQGKGNIDDYSLTELEKFNTLILFGYSYHNQGSAFSLLDQYLKNGGNVLLSTGWQYVDKDWQLQNTPAFFPVDGLHWTTEFNKNSVFRIPDATITQSVDPSRFDPLSWNGQGWGISLPTSVKSWAHPLLLADGKPLMVGGNYGAGKIIWTGWNMIGHMYTYNFNPQEMQFFDNVLSSFGVGNAQEEAQQTQKVTAVRESPDKVVFTLNDNTTGLSTLFWREAQFANWKAYLIDTNGTQQQVTTYTAGPNLTLLRLPQVTKGSMVILQFVPGLRTLFGDIISSVFLVMLIVYIFLGDRLIKVLLIPFDGIFHRVGKPVHHRVSKGLQSWWDKEGNEEEQY